MGLGSILGTGVFVSLGIAADIVGPWLIPAAALAALVATANGLSSAQLAAAHPVSGGTYAYGRRFLHPAAGFAAGWMYLVAKSASAATAALGCAGYILRLLPVEMPSFSQTGFALFLVLALSRLVSGGVRRSGRMNGVIVTLTLISLGTFIAVGVSQLEATDLRAHLHFDDETHWSAPSFLHATGLLFVAYTGYGRIATLGEEVQDPAQTIPRAMIVTLVCAAVLYVSIAAVAVATVGAPSFAAATQDTGAPLEMVAHHLQSPALRWVVASGAVTAMAGVLLNLLLGLSRIVLSMARHGDAPAWFQRIDPQSQSPKRAVWIVGIAIAVLVILGDIRSAWSFSAMTVLLYYGLTNLAALRLPSDAARYPRWISWAGLCSCSALALFIDGPIMVAGVATLFVGFVLRWAIKSGSAMD